MPKVSSDLDFVKVSDRRDVGADVFIESGKMPDEVGKSLEQIVEGSKLKLKMISNRGTQVYPVAAAAFDGVDHHRCRFVMEEKSQAMTEADLLDLLQRVGQSWRWIHVERLPEYNGEPGYTKAQGED